MNKESHLPNAQGSTEARTAAPSNSEGAAGTIHTCQTTDRQTAEGLDQVTG